MTDDRVMHQVAPFPEDLDRLVGQLVYRRGWVFSLVEVLDRGQGSEGLTLVIRVSCDDSYDQDRQRTVLHFMPVPPAAFLGRDWQRWLPDQVLEVERHEACEFFTVDGVKPYAPNHGPGRNPYTIVELGTADDAATDFRGEVKR